MAITTTSTTVGVGSSTQTTNTNYLQPNGFRISIDRKYFPNLQFFAQNIMHPAMTVNAVPVPIPRMSQGLKMTGDTIDFGELSMMVIMDEDLAAYKEIYNWMQSFVNQQDASPMDVMNGAGPSFADITVSITNSHNNVIKQIIYKNAIPTSLGDIMFEAATGDVQYIIMPINFAFDQFEIKDV
jgi:hypothetical protein|tara:strand:- start:3487 stop:4035 length:549 start_codon:yes stop_codon:yes gene_type:complete